MSDKPKYEYLETTAVKGFETKTKKKYIAEGWELVSEEKKPLRTALKFRREKKPISKKTIALGVAGAILLASIFTVGALTEDKTPDKNESSQTQEHVNDEEPTKPAEEELQEAEVLTIENSPDLKRLLTGTDMDYAFWQEFYDKYKMRDIEFDGNVANMLPLQGYKYTYSVLFLSGDYDVNTAPGAPLRDTSIVTPYGWQSTTPDAEIGLGTNLRIRATIFDYNPNGNIFDIHLVSTTVR